MNKKTVDPIAAATNIIQKLDIRSPSEIIVELIAEQRGATVVESFLSSAEGRLVCRGNKGKITVPMNETNVGRKRFSIAHELGHFELHSHLANIISCSKKDMFDWQGYKKRETEANLFSAELLMPRSLFEANIIRKKPNLNLIEELSEKFKTSLTATAFRYTQLTKEPCALIHSTDGKINWFLKNEFDYFLKGKGQNLDEDSFAYDAFKGKGDNPSGSAVSANTWLECYDSRYDDIEFIESTKYLEYYNSAITLLWLP